MLQSVKGSSPCLSQKRALKRTKKHKKRNKRRTDFVPIVHVRHIWLLNSAEDAGILPTRKPILFEFRALWVTFWKNIL